MSICVFYGYFSIFYEQFSKPYLSFSYLALELPITILILTKMGQCFSPHFNQSHSHSQKIQFFSL